MKRRSLIAGTAAALSAAPLARPHAQRNVTIRWWYHFDDPKATPDELVGNFERENPGIKIQAENIPWGGGGDYDTRLYTALIAGNGPDTAMVKFNNLARLMEMEALKPLWRSGCSAPRRRSGSARRRTAIPASSASVSRPSTARAPSPRRS